MLDHRRTTDPRRAELADFLRTRRTALSPESAGFPSSLRRRTPGLRREEVAELANLSVALYTWLEQGRDIPVSARSIDAIADALQLTPSERMHVHRLVRPGQSELREEISPALRRLAGSLRTHPLFVLDHAWDIVLHNDAAHAVFDSGGDEGSHNMLESVFTECRFRSLFDDWEKIAQGLIEQFRLDYAIYADNPRSQEVVENLLAASPLFRTLWEQHRVREFPEGLRELRHPVAGTLVLEPTIYAVIESPGLRVMLFTPFEAQTAERIEGLVAEGERTGATASNPPAVTLTAASKTRSPCAARSATASSRSSS
jgi:transcriptional regulator with XRE-family HTH domain